VRDRRLPTRRLLAARVLAPAAPRREVQRKLLRSPRHLERRICFSDGKTASESFFLSEVPTRHIRPETSLTGRLENPGTSLTLGHVRGETDAFSARTKRIVECRRASLERQCDVRVLMKLSLSGAPWRCRPCGQAPDRARYVEPDHKDLDNAQTRSPHPHRADDGSAARFSEQSRAEQSRAEQRWPSTGGRAEQSRAAHDRAQQVEWSSAWQSRHRRAEQSRAKQRNAEPSRAEPSGASPS